MSVFIGARIVGLLTECSPKIASMFTKDPGNVQATFVTSNHSSNCERLLESPPIPEQSYLLPFTSVVTNSFFYFLLRANRSG